MNIEEVQSQLEEEGLLKFAQGTRFIEKENGSRSLDFPARRNQT